MRTVGALWGVAVHFPIVAIPGAGQILLWLAHIPGALAVHGRALGMTQTCCNSPNDGAMSPDC